MANPAGANSVQLSKITLLTVPNNNLGPAVSAASPSDSPKITCPLGGNYNAGVTPDGQVTGYGQAATVAAKGLITYHSHATYIGPRWEVGEASQTSIGDSGVQKPPSRTVPEMLPSGNENGRP